MSAFAPALSPAWPSFADELPYLHFQDIERGIVLLDTPHAWKPRLALGCAWQVQPVNIEVLEEAQCLAIGRQHEALLRGLPTGTALQTLMTIFPSTTAPAWEQARGHCTPSAVLAAQRAAIAGGLPHRAGTMRARLREIQTLVTLRFPLSTIDPTVATVVKTLLSLPRSYGAACAAQLTACLAPAMAYFTGLRLSIEETLRSVGHGVEALDGYGLARCLARALDPLGTQPLPVVLPEQALREQILPLPLETERIPGGWRYGTTDVTTGALHEAYRCQVLSLHRVMQQTYPGMLSAPRAPSDSKPMALWDAWEQPLTIVVNTAAMDQAVEERRLTIKSWVAGLQAKFSVKNREIQAQVETLLTQQMLTGSQTGWARIHVVVWGQAETLVRGVESVQRAAGRLKMQLAEEPTLGSTLFLQTLPLGMDPSFPTERCLRRARRMDLGNLTHFLTLYGGMQGTETASVLYLNQRGEASAVNLFDNPTNPHLNVVGTSGAGKTYHTGYWLNQILPLGAYAVLLDPLENYRGLCEEWEGERISLDLNTPLCINPFAGPLDNAHVGFLAASLAEMATGGVERLSREESTTLAGALTYFAATWDSARGEACLSRFVEEVLGDGCFSLNDPVPRRLGKGICRKLAYFYGEGLYAGFVDGRNALRLDARLTLIEFASLHNAQDLQGVLFFALMHLITRRFESAALAGIWKTIIADELWALLKHTATAAIIEKIIRTYRNIQASAMFLSQRAQDWESPVGSVIRSIADTTLFLKQTSGEMSHVRRLFELTEAEVALFGEVDKHHGWSSGFLRLPNHQGGIVRIIPDAMTDLLMSQAEAMRLKREHLRAEHGTLRAALQEAAAHG